MAMPQPLLPKHTVVKVIGNARTKQSLVGLTGRVKKAVGLGGWHHGGSTSLFCILHLPACSSCSCCLGADVADVAGSCIPGSN